MPVPQDEFPERKSSPEHYGPDGEYKGNLDILFYQFVYSGDCTDCENLLLWPAIMLLRWCTCVSLPSESLQHIIF